MAKTISAQERFSWSMACVLDDEGRGLALPPSIDQPTHSGITRIALREYVNPDATYEDVAKLSEAEVASVYRLIWDDMKCDEIPVPLDYLVFGCAVNPGKSWAAVNLQEIIGAKADGVIGPKTLARLNKQAGPGGPETAIRRLEIAAELTARRCLFYATRSKVVYREGLLRRATRALTRAVTFQRLR